MTVAGLQFDHAWLEDANGRVVDPTPSYADMADGARTYFAGPRWTLSEVLALFTPDGADLPTPLLRPSADLSPRRETWIRAKIAAFRHASALHHARTGRPAIEPVDEGAMLEGLLGCYWAEWVLEAGRTTALRWNLPAWRVHNDSACEHYDAVLKHS